MVGIVPSDEFDDRLRTYISELNRSLSTGTTTEHTHRPAFKTFIESVCERVQAINEPGQFECGAPDFIVLEDNNPIGYVEAKNLGHNLDSAQEEPQLTRYRQALPNLILTDYLEFRWFVGGESRAPPIRIARFDTHANRITIVPGGAQLLREILDGFLTVTTPTVTSPEQLAQRLSSQARLLRQVVEAALWEEQSGGPLLDQFHALKELVIGDLTETEFADIYAQTVAYGLFAARCHGGRAVEFTRQNAPFGLPSTNPFLRKLFGEIAGPDADERLTWLVDAIAKLLNHTDPESILKNLSEGTGKDDLVTHFYESFLAAYDPEVRNRRGIYYTPMPIVSFIVASVDRLLESSFGRTQGLADPDTLVLDPACGTGTFLFRSVETIHSRFSLRPGAWKTYVGESLLHRIFGFEILMAPYSIAHLKLGLQLEHLGYDFTRGQRLGVYLTNTLEEGVKRKERLGFARFITDESAEATHIKRELPIMVILGNPPYFKRSANRNPWIEQLQEDYFVVDGKPLAERKVWIQDDYIKFLRFAQWKIDSTGRGIVAFITNHGYLDNPTLRGMRQSLLASFGTIYILNLHGSTSRKERAPDGSKDENVFDIRPGVAITMLVKNPELPARKVFYADVWGNAQSKFELLSAGSVETVEWREIKPLGPNYFLVPKNLELQEEYDAFWPVSEVFPKFTSGITTARDGFVVAFDSKTLKDRLRAFIDRDLPDSEIRAQFGLRDSRGWSLESARKHVRGSNPAGWDQQILYRPLDRRRILYSPLLVDWPRGQEMQSMLKPNLAILTHRPQSPTTGFTFVTCTDGLADQCSAANKSVGGGNTYLYPLYVYDEKGRRKLNLASSLLSRLNKSAAGAVGETPVTPEEVFSYVYAILHSPGYRERYAESLKIALPRVPFARDLNLFHKLAKLGKELIEVHLLKTNDSRPSAVGFPVAGNNTVARGFPKWGSEKSAVYLNETQYFSGIDQETWATEIGGYRVADKWLRDRVRQSLTYSDIEEYCAVISALRRTREIAERIDEEVGDWPFAHFSSAPATVTVD